MYELTISPEMIEAVFREWEATHPGRIARNDMTADQFAGLLMAKVIASARELPEGNA